MKKFLLIPVLLISVLLGQLKVTSIEKVPIPSNERWSNPIFSPSGKEIFVTNESYNGIWQYSLSSKLLKVITTDEKSGYNFVISDDGQKIAYRRTVVEGDHISRIQEVVELDLQSLSKNVLNRGNSISTPVFNRNTVTTLEKISMQKVPSRIMNNTIQVVGIEETKIVLLENGMKKIFDPFKNGSYIWPQLSPDKKKIVAVEMGHSTFVCDIDGSNIIFLGRLNAPQWDRSGFWLIGMEDVDDGHRLISSNIFAKSFDGKQSINLTETFAGIAMYPSCSAVENKIIFNTPDGNVFVLMYEEVK